MTSDENIFQDCDLIGFAYPVWGSTLPNPQRILIEKMQNGNGKKAFLIGNAGAFSGDTSVHWKNVIEQKGYDVVYASHVFLPINSIFPGFTMFKQPSESKKSKMLKTAQKQLIQMCHDILSGKRKYKGSGLIAAIGGRGQRNHYDPIVDKFKAQMFIDKDTCTNCNLCYKICPANAISKGSEHPTINTNECIFCLKCYNMCPMNAALKEKESMNTEKYPRYKGIDNKYKPTTYR